MNQDTINALLELNRQFYGQVAQPFSESRQSVWEGWTHLFSQGIFTNLHGASLRVLDLGCGNGRFLQFLASVLKSEKIEYVGIDQSAELLELAQSWTLPPTIKTTFIHSDLTSYLSSQLDLEDTKPFEVIALFGVLHHLPGLKLQQAFFSQLHSWLEPEGKIVFTTWRFLDTPRLKAKCVQPELVGLKSSALEANDYILDWQRGSTAYRYCHYYSEQEVRQLLDETMWQIDIHFLADGRDHQTNQYFVASKKSEYYPPTKRSITAPIT